MLTAFTVIAALLGAVQAAPAETTPPAAAAAPPHADNEAADDDREEVVCRRERVLGSNRHQRICQTRHQWSAQRDASQEAMRELEGGSGESLPGYD